ncbi:hypothetical protein F3Y22_tig00110691pilonHSYRG00112 [Hibiscus syriacus]|uniref:Uncharacterized protein n=1 Tax=Hibiscus syriacus TaxID=106335 RepID=A0A6A2ZV41_HIBSY|nr:hypothetical protein F3Y22_tig00110691pilonHSYRG00112 [Hibiscus syriacus]
MEAKYHEKAVQTGSLIVSACGFDSIPAEMGVMFNTRQWEAPAVPNHVTAYVSLESDKRIVGNFATYESAVLGVANMDKWQELRRSRPRKPRAVVSDYSAFLFVFDTLPFHGLSKTLSCCRMGMAILIFLDIRIQWCPCSI